MPFFILFVVTGTLYLAGIKGESEKKLVKTFDITLSKNVEILDAQVKQILKDEGIKFDYEYLKIKGKSIYLRPTSRDYYVFERAEQTKLYKVESSFQKKMMELHKGHGPTLFKRFSIVFGVGLFLVGITGIYLGVSVKAYRRTSLIYMGLGTLFSLLVLLI
jgi:hypothetical protein